MTTSKSNPQTELLDRLNQDDLCTQLAELKACIFDEPDINQAKIEVIREAISSGEYQVKSRRIASCLMGIHALNEEQLELA